MRCDGVGHGNVGCAKAVAMMDEVTCHSGCVGVWTSQILVCSGVLLELETVMVRCLVMAWISSEESWFVVERERVIERDRERYSAR